MCKAVDELVERRVDELAERRAEERRIDTILNNVQNLMETMKLSVEQAMDALRVSESDKVILLKRF